ncbi:hypothetical protein [Thalassotalea ganghwensis]
MRFIPLALSVFISVSITPIALADGLSDLTSKLALLKGSQPIKATLNTQTSYQQGDGKDKVIKNGLGEVILSANTTGLQVTYSDETLLKLEQEARAQIKDENAPTPTLNAINRNSATELKNTLSAASSIERMIAQATYIGEQSFEQDNQTLRKLSFDLPMQAIINDKRTREYVSKFSSNFEVVIDDEGVPISSELTFSGKGRAYIVLSVKAHGFSRSTYQVIHQRLVQTLEESGSTFDSTFGFSERSEQNILTLNQESYANTQMD